MTGHVSELREHATHLLALIGRLSGTLAEIVGERTARVAAAYRAELRRVAAVVALALAAALLTCAAAAFAAFSILVAFWETYPVLVSASIAAALAGLALLAVALIRRQTRAGAIPD